MRSLATSYENSCQSSNPPGAHLCPITRKLQRSRVSRPVLPTRCRSQGRRSAESSPRRDCGGRPRSRLRRWSRPKSTGQPPPPRRPCTGRLLPRAARSPGAALDCVLEAQEVLARVLSPEELAGLTREVQNFAFDEALVRLRAIAACSGTATAGGDGAALGGALPRLETMLADGNGEALDCALAAGARIRRRRGWRTAARGRQFRLRHRPRPGAQYRRPPRAAAQLLTRNEPR